MYQFQDYSFILINGYSYVLNDIFFSPAKNRTTSYGQSFNKFDKTKLYSFRNVYVNKHPAQRDQNIPVSDSKTNANPFAPISFFTNLLAHPFQLSLLANQTNIKFFFLQFQPHKYLSIYFLVHFFDTSLSAWWKSVRSRYCKQKMYAMHPPHSFH